MIKTITIVRLRSKAARFLAFCVSIAELNLLGICLTLKMYHLRIVCLSRTNNIRLTKRINLTFVTKIAMTGTKYTMLNIVILQLVTFKLRSFHSTLQLVRAPSSEQCDQPIRGIVAQNRPFNKQKAIAPNFAFMVIVRMLHGRQIT